MNDFVHAEYLDHIVLIAKWIHIFVRLDALLLDALLDALLSIPRYFLYLVHPVREFNNLLLN